MPLISALNCSTCSQSNLKRMVLVRFFSLQRKLLLVLHKRSASWQQHCCRDQTHLSGQTKDLLHQLLGLWWFLKKQLDDGSQQGKLHLLSNKHKTHHTTARFEMSGWIKQVKWMQQVTCVLSSWKPSRKLSSSSSALSIRSAYSPTIQIMAARASGSSSESRFSQRVAMMLSYLRDTRVSASADHTSSAPTKLSRGLFGAYLLGYLRKMSLMTTMASCTT